MKELIEIQHKLKAPKNQYNSFGKYKYRNAEDILEAVKPLLAEHNCTLTISDEIVLIGDRIYVKATTLLTNDKGVTVSTTAYAREEENKKGMDASQVTGATSSYARKYALNGLFCIDDTKDADSMDNTQSGSKPVTTSTPTPTVAQKKKDKLSMNQVGESLFKWIDKKKIALKQQGKDMTASDIVATAYDITAAVAEHIDMEYRYHVRKNMGVVTAEHPSAIELGAVEFETKEELI